MAAAMEEQSPLLERIGSVLLNGLFGLGLIARDQKSKASGLRQGSTSFGGLGFILATVIEAGQMLAFPFSAVQTVWQGTIIRSAALPVLTVVMPASLDLWFGPAAYQVMFFLGIAWVLIFISLSVSIAVAFIREKKQSEFALRLFRGVAVLSTTVLFLPVSSLLFRSYSCSAGSDISGSTDDWLGAGIPCDNVSEEVDCIGKLKAMQPAPDLAFVVFVRGIELSDSTAAEGGLAPIDRVMFEQMSNETRALRTTALRSMVELWAHLEQRAARPLQGCCRRARGLDADIVRYATFLFSRISASTPSPRRSSARTAASLSGLGFDPVRGMELRKPRRPQFDEVASRSRVGKVARA
ncbi:hypothetical protein FNF28_06581 [Cafeteria roenbergensis]|uniref:Uncharacterized protein n=1 Tax=Cafeteria roenbergensis TaxID=33653 RepID=A0A5A8CUZ3_CAFRO|nr:hypothetical protein FNF28_06581 [Cafeteria roenbergensis]